MRCVAIFAERSIVDIWQFSVCLGFKIYQCSEYASTSKHARILNITFPKYKENFFIENIRKIRFLKNRKLFLLIFFRAITFRKKYKKFFREKFWGLSPESGLGSVIIHYYQKFRHLFNVGICLEELRNMSILCNHIINF